MALTLGSLKSVFGWSDPKSVMNYGEGMQNQSVSHESLEKAAQEIRAYQLEREKLLAAQRQAQINQLQASISSGMGQFTMKRDPDKAPLPPLSMSDLESPAGKVSLEELSDLWRARWGNAWVKRSEITDEFYTVCAVRLVASRRLEAHQLADGAHVYRLDQ